MKRLVTSATVALAAMGCAVVPAAAQTPNGKGLTDPFPVSCPDLGGTVLMVEPAGYAPSHWTLDNRHYVVRDLQITSPDGTFSRSFGEKRNLPTIECTASHEDQSAVVTFSVLPEGADQ